MTEAMQLNLAALPLTRLKGVGPSVANALQQLHLFTVQDLLFHLPVRYEDRTHVTPIKELTVGNKVLVSAEVRFGAVQGGKRRSFVVCVQQGDAILHLRFFYFNASQVKMLSQFGVRLTCFGEVRMGYRNQLEMIHPQYRVGCEAADFISESLTPIYPSVAGLTQATWLKLTEQALKLLTRDDVLPECIPESFLTNFAGFSLVDSLRLIHRPPPKTAVQDLIDGTHPALQRLIFEELVAQQLGLLRFRAQFRQRIAPALPGPHILQQQVLAALPFALTRAQARVLEEINQDLAQPHPMLRLIQGDVGSGKTVLAALACLSAVEHGLQAALMAPTDILSGQHVKNFQTWFSPLGLRVGWLSGSQKERERQKVLESLASQELSVVVGTHALFQEAVEFAKLGVVVVDEQHRFGVQQRLALKDKGKIAQYYPHQLIMTATPIPRTLAMSVYADLDVSVIDELPPGRKPISTVLLSNQRRGQVIARVNASCQQGRQAYWVCTLVEDSEILRAEAAQATLERLRERLPHLNIQLIHGRLKPEEKESVMRDFIRGHINLLVATTVIEVGVDVPNASLMIIENAERLGLAQLHQLRGRVGRGEQESFCVLLYQEPLSKTARLRLKKMRESQNGFEIAEADLKIRGPGELLGTKQTGLLRLRVADLVRDRELLPQVNEVSAALLKSHPQRVASILARWLSAKQRYAEV